jgi:putative sugar O-methyltransferase
MSPGGAPDEIAVLAEMTSALEAGPEIYRPSKFWADLTRVHRAQLERLGFDNFKRTVNTKYFNWRILGIVRHQLGVVGEWLRRPDFEVFRARFPQPSYAPGGRIASFNAPSAWIYKTFVAIYADSLARHDPLGLLRRLEEPTIGNPFSVVHRGRSISQDLCNSIHELYSIFGPNGAAIAGGAPLEVAELGAGYGRLAYVIVSASPGVRYTIIDVPPALYLSQRYLTALFPQVAAFRFRPWDDFAAIRDEFSVARLRFLLPHQAELLPDRSVDYFINISQLHEMSRPQVERYFALMDRICRGRVYTKQWRVSRTPVNDVVFRERDYPVPARWRTLYHRRHPVQRMFFEALYEVG